MQDCTSYREKTANPIEQATESQQGKQREKLVTGRSPCSRISERVLPTKCLPRQSFQPLGPDDTPACRSSSVNRQDRERKTCRTHKRKTANAVSQRENALLSVMPELMFRRVLVGSVMLMQGESIAKGKFNHWEGQTQETRTA
ncbi:unnamed protein product [Sphenostylis stenocarpa]|uniref:Uncharacterized protein n=1 Tax=Sphenostylis stenocarpa TaxID=92480 RepID=A0AA86TJ93_9FABA|nr:unnamed protein product [Sphenostylis stenocarpa]